MDDEKKRRNNKPERGVFGPKKNVKVYISASIQISIRYVYGRH